MGRVIALWVLFVFCGLLAPDRLHGIKATSTSAGEVARDGSSESIGDLLVPSRTERGVRCRNAVRKVKTGQIKRHCQVYNRTRIGGVCRKYLGEDLLFSNNAYQEKAESNVILLTKILSSIVTLLHVRIPGRCRRALIESACRQEMPLCGLSKRKPHPMRMCQSSCDFVVQQKCGAVLRKIEGMKRSEQEQAFIQKFLVYIKSRCQELPSQYDSNFMPCYSIFNHERHEMVPSSGSCHERRKTKYTGKVSKTVTGHTCQAWTSQCPHRHMFTTERYPELFDAGNSCRDPGGIRGRPWCYTSNARTRWQYCKVRLCSDKRIRTARPKVRTRTTPKPQKKKTARCKGNCGRSATTAECNDKTNSTCMPTPTTHVQIDNTLGNCTSAKECNGAAALGMDLTQQEDQKGNKAKENWVIYVSVGAGSCLLVAIVVFALLRTSCKAKEKQSDDTTGQSSLAEPEETVTPKRWSASSSGKHSYCEVGYTEGDSKLSTV